MDSQTQNNDEIKKEMENMRRDRNDLKGAIEDIQVRSMKNNLVFTGLREERYERTEEKLREFIRCELGIDRHIEFGNVHRFQKHVFGNTRPIVARFLFNNDRQAVKERSYLLRGTRFGISEQFPTTIEDRSTTNQPATTSN